MAVFLLPLALAGVKLDTDSFNLETKIIYALCLFMLGQSYCPLCQRVLAFLLRMFLNC